MAKINSRAKGKGTELKACNILKAAGFAARRSQQFCGRNPDASDIVTPDFPDIYWEIKGVETLGVQKTMARCREDCGDKDPVLLWFKNNKPPLAVIGLSLFLELLKLYRLDSIFWDKDKKSRQKKSRDDEFIEKWAVDKAHAKLLRANLNPKQRPEATGDDEFSSDG